MRWELSIVCATERPGSFGTHAGNDMARAAGIQRELAAGRYTHAGEVSLWDALHPPEDAMFVGAYPEGVLICHADLAGALIHGNTWSRVAGSLRGDFRDTVLQLYPAGEVMALVLHCVTDLWGFSSYRASRRVRTIAGAGQEDVFADGGQPLEEERQPGIGTGEERVLAASGRMFGCGIDRLPGTGPALSYFRRR